MADYIPFVPSDNNYRLVVPLSDVTYLFDTYWNARDNSWYFDFRRENEDPILLGVKVVLGVNFGRGSTDEFFQNHTLRAIDTSGESREAGYDDLGARVKVVHVDLRAITGTL